ncbi:MAG: NADH-quinone oxidoreductase subunit L [Deltaproteobacteria bacterium]|nr:NADH-quinone oxidoreductase subunit L [Deltaproteobacteria bacterium]
MRPESYSLLYLIPLFPLIGAATLTLFGARLPKPLVVLVALGGALGAFTASVASTWVFYRLQGAPLEAVLWEWIAVGRYTFDFTLGFDALTSALILVVTGVGFLIHVYSVGYMKEDPGFFRYFAYLNFFIFAMSILALGRSLPVMFIGWEGVGLASYLLIGFWYADPDKALAGKKAFIVNRIGDFGFLVGIFTLVALFGTGDFQALKEAAEGLRNLDVPLASGLFADYTPRAVITFACLSLFVGACGKSAQIPLYVWLPDAMAGPTPVSALIHAATMVTAGVYMVVRLNFFFSPEVAPIAMHTIAWIGGLTAIFAASIGLAQNDIKKVLAYSTVSQLGYMFLAAGLGAYSAAVFHLVTHAFFKACLFLGSGAVIHALHGEQDMRRMGGLRRPLPVVFWTFLISTLALAGVAPLAGFFSKDAILAEAFERSRPLWMLGFLGAGLTALYMGRLLGLTFFGSARYNDAHGHAHAHADAHDGHGHGHGDAALGAHGSSKGMDLHKPDLWMRTPLVLLGALALVAGILNLPHIFHHEAAAGGHGLETQWFDHYLASVVGSSVLNLDAATEWLLMGVSVAWAVFWLFAGYVIYRRGPSAVLERVTRGGPVRWVHVLLREKWFVDEIYEYVIVTPVRLLASVFAWIIDPFVIDGLFVKGSAFGIRSSGRGLSWLQTGNIQSYATVFVVAVAAIILWAV